MVLQSLSFVFFYWFNLVWVVLGFFFVSAGFVLSAESEGVKGFDQSKLHLKSFMRLGKERKCFARVNCQSPASAAVAPNNSKCTSVTQTCFALHLPQVLRGEWEQSRAKGSLCISFPQPLQHENMVNKDLLRGADGV